MSDEAMAGVMCHNGHPFEPGIDEDDIAEDGRAHGDPRWCNVCGEARIVPDHLRVCGCLPNDADAHRVGCPRFPLGKRGTR